MGRGSPVCERVRKKIVEYFKNNVPQCQIPKALQISSSTVHNIIKIQRKKRFQCSFHNGFLEYNQNVVFLHSSLFLVAINSSL